MVISDINALDNTEYKLRDLDASIVTQEQVKTAVNDSFFYNIDAQIYNLNRTNGF
jgi:hypothetical protein